MEGSARGPDGGAKTQLATIATMAHLGAVPDPRPVEPIRMQVRVRRPIADAFRLFTEGIGTWWPTETYRVRGPVVEVVFEGRPRGRVYERGADGRTSDWGEVLAWEPPGRVVFSWNPSVRPAAPPTEVEARFTAEDESTTLVDVEHRGWERLGDLALQARSSYANGWPLVLARFRATAGAA